MPGGGIIIISNGGGTIPRTATTLPAPCSAVQNDTADMAEVQFTHLGTPDSCKVDPYSTFPLPHDCIVTSIT